MTEEISALAQDLEGLPTAELHERLRAVIDRFSLADRFTLLHRLGVYHHPESLSGAGSTLEETAVLREALPKLVQERKVIRLLDLPCGDFHWMQEVALGADYIGADVVPEIVAANQANYGNENRKFVVLDATSDPLPCVDLVMCRDLLIHLSDKDCWAILANVVASGARLLLATHYANHQSNPDILSGDFRPINLCSAPFHLPPPVQVINEESSLADGIFRDRAMGLWQVEEIAGVVGRGSGVDGI